MKLSVIDAGVGPNQFLFDLRQPNPDYLRASIPLIERNPALFWKCSTALLTLIVIAMAAAHHAGRW